jgi:hypothetical protein
MKLTKNCIESIEDRIGNYTSSERESLFTEINETVKDKIRNDLFYPVVDQIWDSVSQQHLP